MEHLRSTFSLTLLVQTKKQPDKAAIRAYLHNLMEELSFFLVSQKWAKIDIPGKFARKHTQISANSIPRGGAQWDHGRDHIVRSGRRETRGRTKR